MSLHPVLAAVTDRIRGRSATTRAAYLSRLEQARGKGPIRQALGCTNLAHGFAAAPAGDKIMAKIQKVQKLRVGAWAIPRKFQRTVVR